MLFSLDVDSRNGQLVMVTFGKALIMQVGNYLYMIRVGKQHRLEVEYVNAGMYAATPYTTGEKDWYSFAVRASRLGRLSENRLLFRLPHEILAGYDIRVPIRLTWRACTTTDPLFSV